jgi:2-dehydro-3-deoxy-D-arabinonate dehydratase
MRVFKTNNGIVLEKNDTHLLIQADWDSFINDDSLLEKLKARGGVKTKIGDHQLLAPIGKQELWACGVTYLRSMVGRQEESQSAGGGDFYSRVYDAVRPEVFFKATPYRVVGHGGVVRIRKDSTWNVPEPELTLVVTSSGNIIGYTIGNDMSSRSIEGENPLYLPQAKTYDGCAAVGPCIYVSESPLSVKTQIALQILRNGETAVDGNISIGQMKRSFDELVSFVYRECTFPYGCLIMTGTGIVPPKDFTLIPGDEVRITIDPIGTLSNLVGD